jgi:hypothetical protein
VPPCALQKEARVRLGGQEGEPQGDGRDEADAPTVRLAMKNAANSIHIKDRRIAGRLYVEV